MPFIEIRNFPERNPREVNDADDREGRKWKQAFACALRAATVEAEVPGIPSVDLVTVTFGGSQVIEDDWTISIICDFLFEREDRTKVVLNRLAEHLYYIAREFFPDKYRIEVIIRPFDTSRGAYRTD